MQIIETSNGDYRFKKLTFSHGGKVIDRHISKQNLLEFKKVMDKTNMKFLLAYGTLLGAIRENDFIAHDEDVDVIILDEDRKAFIDLLFDLRLHGFEVGRYEDDLFSLVRDGEYIDIYIFRKSYLGYRKMGNFVTKEKFLLNSIKYEFLGKEFDIPKDYIEYLVYNYGVDWKIPQKNAHAYKPGFSLTIKHFLNENAKPLFEIIRWLKKNLIKIYKILD